jgi:hypothetical protein
MARCDSATLLVFTLGPRADARRHPLLGPAASGLELGLRRACLEGAFEAGRAAGLELAVCSPDRLPEAPRDARWQAQGQGTFAARFEAAVEQALRHRTEPLIVVGGDVPGLRADHLAAARRELAADPHAVVVGPARDGGFYLLAMARPLGSVLGDVSFCGRNTRKTLLAALARAGRAVVLLPPLLDLDRPADVEGWLRDGTPLRGAVRPWSERVRLFLRARRKPPAPRRLRALSPRVPRPVRGRAPPPVLPS